MGGIVGVAIGATEGIAMQTVGGQIGGMSFALSHSGCIEPPSHSHEHPALAVVTEIAIAAITIAVLTSPSLLQYPRFA
jgi:hypothetical protein